MGGGCGTCCVVPWLTDGCIAPQQRVCHQGRVSTPLDTSSCKYVLAFQAETSWSWWLSTHGVEVKCVCGCVGDGEGGSGDVALRCPKRFARLYKRSGPLKKHLVDLQLVIGLQHEVTKGGWPVTDCGC